MFDMICAGFAEALHVANLFFVLLGVIAGVIAGAIPGINGPMAIALCIPLSYYMSPVAAIGFLVGLNKGAFFGGSISGILLNTPGTPESAATTWDGHPLAQQGKGEKALRTALYASVTGDAFATLVLILVAAPLAAVALYMGPPEVFALICMAMTIIAGLGTKSMIRGLIAASLGVLIGTIGIEPVSAMPRLTFGIVSLERGISLIPIGIGMLAFSEIIIQLERIIGDKGKTEVLSFSPRPEDRFVSLKEYLGCAVTLLRSSIAGTIVGALPGLGAPVASFFAYDQAVKHSKHPEEFGTGRLEGIAASESANSAVVASSLIPLFTLGIPGNMAAALLIGAFVLHGMTPGPLMFEQNAQFIYAIYGSLIVANIFLLGVGQLGLKVFCKMVSIPPLVLYPIIIFTCVMGSYLSQYSSFDVTLMIAFSLLAYFMRKFEYSFICLIIGFILAPIWETSLQQVIIASEQDPFMFFKHPVADILMVLTFIVICKSVFSIRKG
ncbi:MAG: tripartite tricarboxylate transporter permease [Desulfovibrio sp.]|nr:tripartite tricarboxylate transporter permease [Desulfovibrio sp.]